MNDLRGRAAFITGGAQGIGLGIARELAENGVSLALADIDRAALDAAEEELGHRTTLMTLTLDVRDRDAFLRCAEVVEARIGPVTLLFNNAGVADAIPASRMSAQQYDWVVGVNLTGVFNGILSFVPRMVERGDGHVVNTASTAGVVAGGSGAGWLYHASKFGVVGMSEALRVELEPLGVGVSVLCPGPVATQILNNSNRNQPDEALRPLMPHAGGPGSALVEYLAQGAQPTDVGKIVIEGVVANRPYIFTDTSAADGIRVRASALLAAMPVASD